MKNTLPVFAVIFTTCAASVAHAAPATSGAAPAESPGLLKKIFGSRQGQRVTFAPEPKAEPKAAPTAPAAPTAKPKVKPRKKTVAKANASGSDDAPAAGKTAKGTKPAAAPKPAAPAAEPDASATPAPAPDVVAPPPVAPSAAKKKGKGKAPAAAVAPEDADAEAKELARYEEVKAKAAAEPGVAELKTKADAAVFDEEGKNAQRAYNKALFEQMRKLDGSLEGRINAMEAAILKKLAE